MSRPGEGGVAVPLALVLVVALGLLGTGVLILAERQATTTAAAVSWTRSRVVARGVLKQMMGSAPGAGLPATPLWAPEPRVSGRHDGIDYGVDVRRLGREWGLITGWGRASPASPRVEEATVAWSLDPLARVGSAAAVLVHGGPLVRAADAEVEGTGLAAAGEGGSATSCGAWAAALDSVFPEDRLAPALRDPEPDSLRMLPALGLLGPEELARRLGRHVGGTVSPAPVVDGGACRDAAANWGSPTDPDGPCGARRIAVWGTGDVVLQGGEGQGLLAVDGSLTLVDGVVFAGVVVVRDTLRLGPGARITGLARAGGPVFLGTGATVRGRACPALLALDGVPALRGLLPAPGGAWIRPF